MLVKIAVALRMGGVLFTSFKYGDFEGMQNGRYFTYFTKKTLEAFWRAVPSLKIFDLWITEDVRPDRKGLKWINILARRI